MAPHPIQAAWVELADTAWQAFNCADCVNALGGAMNLRPFIFAAAMGALNLAAQAATGSVDFTIDEYPSLASSAAAADATGAAGYWITDN